MYSKIKITKQKVMTVNKKDIDYDYNNKVDHFKVQFHYSTANVI